MGSVLVLKKKAAGPDLFVRYVTYSDFSDIFSAMDISDSEKERLDELLRLRESGEITNEEYQRLCWTAIKEQNSPPENEWSAPGASGIHVGLSDTGIRKAHSGTRRSILGKNKAGGVDAHLSMEGLSGRYKKSRMPGSHSMLFPRSNFPFLKPIGVMLVSAVLTVYLVRLVFDVQVPGSGFGEGESEPQKTTPIEQIQPLFGQLAVNVCLPKCGIREAEMKTACERACGRLSIRNYARRIDYQDADPIADAEETFRRCTKPGSGERFASGEAWETAMKRALASLGRLTTLSQRAEYGSSRQAYELAYEKNERLMLPEKADGNDEVTKQLSGVLCLRANLALAEMGIISAKQQPDEYSRRFYATFHRALKPKTIDVENALMQDQRIQELMKDAK